MATHAILLAERRRRRSPDGLRSGGRLPTTTSGEVYCKGSHVSFHRHRLKLIDSQLQIAAVVQRDASPALLMRSSPVQKAPVAPMAPPEALGTRGLRIIQLDSVLEVVADLAAFEIRIRYGHEQRGRRWLAVGRSGAQTLDQRVASRSICSSRLRAPRWDRAKGTAGCASAAPPQRTWRCGRRR